MARSFFTAAKLQNKFWFWALREASIQMNMLPVDALKKALGLNHA